MKEKTKDKIVRIIEEREQVTVSELVDILDLSRQIIHRHLLELIEDAALKKLGSPPKVFYVLNREDIKSSNETIPVEFSHIIDKNFFLISPIGERREGTRAFVEWCIKRNFNVQDKAREYVDIFNKYKKYKKEGFISGAYKMKDTFDKVYLDEVYYLDFYSIEVFGKTKLGQMILYAKQSQDRKLIREVVNEIKPNIEKLIKEKKIDAVGYVPPSVKRETQFMKEIEKGLNLSVSKIELVKIQGDVVVPQKTLNKLSDRIENSKQIKLIIGREVRSYKRVLLIDDAVGSGATLNEIARQIKLQKVSSHVIGLALTGSFSGFEVISEV